MQSRAFASLPAQDRVAFWRRFQARYPRVDVSDQLATALQGYETELAELRRQERISDLETRVARAEREAAAARLETEKLRKETEQLRNRARYGLRTRITPRTHQYPNYFRPPTVTIHSTGTSSQNSHNADLNARCNTRHNLGSSHIRHNFGKHAKGPSVKSPLGIRRNQ